MCRVADADTVIVDSLKDAMIGLNDDAVTAGYNRARQHALEGGVQITEVHHNRKKPNGSQAAQHGIDGSPYGSTG